MGKKEDDKDNLFCSFCGKNQKEVTKLIAGPAVYICDECIQLGVEILVEEGVLGNSPDDVPILEAPRSMPISAMPLRSSGSSVSASVPSTSQMMASIGPIGSASRSVTAETPPQPRRSIAVGRARSLQW